jgi:hypothetical protein
MATCTSCKTVNAPGARFCDDCGASLPTGAPTRRIRLGREADNDLVVPAAFHQVSRHHAEVTSDGQTYRISHVGSANATYVNGRPVSGEQTFTLHDEVRLASYVVNTADIAALFKGEPGDAVARAHSESTPQTSPPSPARLTTPFVSSVAMAPPTETRQPPLATADYGQRGEGRTPSAFYGAHCTVCGEPVSGAGFCPACGTAVRARQSGAAFSTVAIILGVMAFLIFPIILGPAGLILGAVAKARNERAATAAIVISALGLVVGMALGIYVVSQQ